MIKPFLPGLVLDKQDQPVVEINSPYSSYKIAGVDFLGMLSGSIAMASGLDNIRNVFNESIGETLNHYYRMTSADSDYKGLDGDGKPVFYNGHYRYGFVIDEVYKTTKWDDTPISDIKFLVNDEKVEIDLGDYVGVLKN